MTESEETLDFLEQQIPSLAASAVHLAYWQALATGQVVLVSEDGGVYQALPDGTKKLVKALKKTSSRRVAVGTRVRIP